MGYKGGESRPESRTYTLPASITNITLSRQVTPSSSVAIKGATPRRCPPPPCYVDRDARTSQW
ncbi:hypothetical protein E2C01_080685 [Portunus trituberculatus]|uniref:Uncharacterized protein n=1 Tax=Portunus trituberculatus TaxID=210409 RepID=A0A5B7IW17_PORTR|nr:hypothetical protein [Portunus trituberculatus]